MNLSTTNNQTEHKLLIYQLFVRLFGNQNTTNKYYGSIEENGCGKFNDINDLALQELKKMCFSHIWFTGVLEHATMTDYSYYGIKPDDPDVVKGRAGSPYAIKDYYDVDPDLAVDVRERMQEFEALIERTHANGMKVIIDFVPNHVARTYQSDTKPEGVRDIGQDDDTTKAFSPSNDFYYLPGKKFWVPGDINPGGDEFKNSLKDRDFKEYPAKATGNDVFYEAPSKNDWYETVKLNYGVDYVNGGQTHFSPIPPLWFKLRDILLFWSAKGIDGFRCDMVEMVPVEFWNWVIAQVKEVYPEVLFIAEAYNPQAYSKYIFEGRFDYLYDKVGLYDTLKKLVRNEYEANVYEIRDQWQHQHNGFTEHMLRFLENHDEIRIASKEFAGNACLALPAMVTLATLSQGPVMVYFGQEVGEQAEGTTGFSSSDGRTSIFDYCGVPEHQKWLNNGKMDGAKLSNSQKSLRNFYNILLKITANHKAISNGAFYDLLYLNDQERGFNNKVYPFLRYKNDDRLLIIANFNRNEVTLQVKFTDDLLNLFNVAAPGNYTFTDLLTNIQYPETNLQQGLTITVAASCAVILSF
ncbi:alpha-amylase family glycosyl hydrolase [Mucilaginibacter arboris]|uniref:Alpha-amylase n=1 Tax=Mucilaginibacter arboris TaxID=2682090 RepID=A0A7K1SX47_9SPHI|nr:alpha-amylase family glycosyl hydrolase [Mucilaginibacter arboris]MVN21899.1 alpha-amylase [Mucilaginibacter arboris]